MSDTPKTWAALKSSDYITAEEFNGKQVTITILSFTKENMADVKDDEAKVKHDGEKKTRKAGVCHFKGSDRGWVLNSTNLQLLAAMWPTPEDSIGHRVTLAAESVKVGKETVLGIRVVGSPELDKPIDVEVKLPRRAPIKRKLVPTGKEADEPVVCERRSLDECGKCDTQNALCPDERGPVDEDKAPW